MASIFGGALGGVVGGAVVKLTLDKSQFDAGLAQARGQTEAGATAMGKFSGLAKAGFAVAGAAALKFAADSLKAFSEAQQVAAQTEAVLKSTGGQAGVTADDVADLANEIRNYSGVDDEAVQASENLLLTFRNVHNEVGKGNDIFNQTERAIVDMATAMNQGAIPTQEQLAQTTIQVGKAMNDPIQGMTALRRVGVTFSESQVKVITKLQEMGDLAGAQKIVLQELQAEFGGAAKAAGDTFAGAMAKANSKIGDFKESVGQLEASFVLLATGDIKGAADLWTDVAIATDGSADAFNRYLNPVQDASTATGQLTAAQSAARTEMQHSTQEQLNLAAALTETQTPAAQAASAADGLRDAMSALNDQLREAWSLENQAAGGLVGLASAEADAEQSKRDLAAAQAKVNDLAADGKKGTQEYKDAVLERNAAELDSIQSQQNLEGQAQSLFAEFKEGNLTLAEADTRLRAQAEAAGLSKQRTNELVGEVNALYREESKIPSDVSTTFTAPGLSSQMSQLVQYWTTLKNIPTHKDVTIVTHYETVGTPGTAGGPQ